MITKTLSFKVNEYEFTLIPDRGLGSGPWVIGSVSHLRDFTTEGLDTYIEALIEVRAKLTELNEG